MKIVRFNEGQIGVCVDETVYDVTGVIGSSDNESWPPVAMNRLIADFEKMRPEILRVVKDGKGVPLSEVTLLTPVPWPNKLMAYPVNYVDHAVEMKSVGYANVQGYFLKSNSSLSGASEPIVLPQLPQREIHHECELAIIIGKTCRDISPSEARAHIFGFSCLIDVTIRGKEERVFRKSYDTFTPVGPWIVTRDEVSDLDNLNMKLWVNDSLRQEANTKDLIVGIDDMIAIASSASTLYPGDIIATGTPAGVGPIVGGDKVTIEIEQVGRMVVDVVQGKGGANSVFLKPAATVA